MNWISRAALEYIGQGGLGYSFDALNEEQTNGYSEAIKAFTYGLLLLSLSCFSFILSRPLVFRLNFLLHFIPQAVKLGPPSFLRRVVELIPSGPIRDLVSITDSIEKHSKEILHDKRQALQDGDKATQEQIGGGKDIMSVLSESTSSYESGSESDM